MWSTKLTEKIGVQLPIIQAPMSGASSPELVAAVSNAGGLGALASFRTFRTLFCRATHGPY